MKFNKEQVKKVLLDAFIGFILWSLFLTPYVILVVKSTFEQYLWWLLMEVILVPPIAPIVIKITLWVEKKVLK